MPATNTAATKAAGGRSSSGARGYSNRGYLFGPWLGVQPVNINNFVRSVGLPMIGNPTSAFQALTGSRLARGAPLFPAPASPAPTAANLVANFRRIIGV